MKKITSLLILILFLISSNIVGQTSKITFSVNIKPQLVDSVFIPGRDQLKLVGDLYPINNSIPYYLIDEEPIDSVYSITIRFGSRFRNQLLNYNFEMMANYIKYTEVMPRTVQLQGRDVELYPIYFNAFAW